MQTYLPYPDFAKSIECLDDKRLNRQRSDVMSILKALSEPPPEDGREHGAIRMWRGNEKQLIKYGLTACMEWAARGNSDATAQRVLEYNSKFPDESNELPEWFGNPEFHLSHQSRLVQLRPSYYREYFPDVPDDLSLMWPRSLKEKKPPAEQKAMQRIMKKMHKHDLAIMQLQVELYTISLAANIDLNGAPLDDETREKMTQFIEEAI